MGRRDPFSNAAAAFVSLIWTGALAGVSFIATPVKFQATSLDLPVALEIGRVTFAVFSRCEWGLAALLAIAVFFSKTSKFQRACTAAAIGMVALQALWLLPVLDARIDAVIAGTPLPPSWDHLFYAGSEGLKLILLCVIATTAVFSLGWRSRNEIVAE